MVVTAVTMGLFHMGMATNEEEEEGFVEVYLMILSSSSLLTTLDIRKFRFNN